MKRLIKLAFLALLFPHGAFALEADRAAPVRIEADQVEMREKEGLHIYSGHVQITKGSIRINGDRITIQNRDGGLSLIVIQGEPATFSQNNDQGEEISASSKVMEYSAETGLLELKEEATLVKNQSQFNSAHIIYDTNRDIVKAGQGQGQGNESNQDKPPRVQITIQPDKNQNKP